METDKSSWPVIRVFSGKVTRGNGCKLIYQIKHPTIPVVGDYVSYQYWNLKVWRVEHLMCDDYEVKADIYVDPIPND